MTELGLPPRIEKGTLALLRQVPSQPERTRALCPRRPPAQTIVESASSRGRGRVALEHLTEPSLDEAGADDGGGKVVEGFADVGPALVAHGEAAEAGEPSQGALHNPV